MVEDHWASISLFLSIYSIVYSLKHGVKESNSIDSKCHQVK